MVLRTFFFFFLVLHLDCPSSKPFFLLKEDNGILHFIPTLLLSLNWVQYVSEEFFGPPGITKNMNSAKMHSQQFMPLTNEAFSKNVTDP